jgi:hypothetical protein
MADFNGELFTAPSLVEGTAGPDGTVNSYPNPVQGDVGVQGNIQNSVLPGTIITVHYYLTATCSTDGLRHYWTDTAISFALAPACAGGYVSGSLAVLGSWETFS